MEEKNSGFSLLPTAYAKLPLKAKYGLYLIYSCRKADKLSKQLGRYIPHHNPTYDEFKEMNAKVMRRVNFK